MKLLLLFLLTSFTMQAISGGLNLDIPVPVSVKMIKTYNITSLEVDVKGKHINIAYDGLDGEEVLSSGMISLSGAEYESALATMPINGVSIYNNIAGVLYTILKAKLSVTGEIVQ